jgi:hypothetical protein
MFHAYDNNGGVFAWIEHGGALRPELLDPWCTAAADLSE